ncbi:hypothetical protein SAMN06265348_10658 [Pedobacter westerhofensis]|uniref:TerB family tellurite resistance protein n=1 Tax=Pedobacter westerhofensis TaxID=425512 RepID=A0A521DP47_9SPHI|nr:hypothetical protein [Pedobacter westerhofensis]SMO73463.1 hypothetical protein SAMN06265348_10658 [Pedobacter westerhofensis]
MGLSRKLLALTFVVLLVLTGRGASAQTWDEIFKQKKTQKKYLIQQIAALQVYIGYARKGYDIVGKGIHAVKDINNGEFNLHRNFFAALGAVNPSVKGSAVVTQVLNGGFEVISILKSWDSSGLNADNRAFVSVVKANLLAECAVELEDFLLIITSGKLDMKDNERLARLELLRTSMENKRGFALAFSGDLDQLTRQREGEQQTINQIRRWHEIQ